MKPEEKESNMTKSMKRSAVLIAAISLVTSAFALECCPTEYYKPKWVHQAPTVDALNYVRAETDEQLRGYADKYKSFGHFVHSRKAYDVNKQVTQGANRDTLYSFGVFDLSKSPLKVTLPETKGRYMSMMIVSQDHDVFPARYAPGTWTITQSEIGTRYIMIVLRTFADPNDPKDMEEAHTLQDKVKASQTDKGDLSGLQKWDTKMMMKLREHFAALGATLGDSSRFFGVKCDRSYFENAMAVAVGWGGLQRQDAFYELVKVPKNDGKTPYVLHVPKEVPVGAFWSVTVYDKNRFLIPNKYNAYSYNSVTAKKNPDGSVDIHFGGDPKAKNFLPVKEGWVYIVRMYRPGKEILKGKWKFPKPVEVK